jgi:hypothetical protein
VTKNNRRNTTRKWQKLNAQCVHYTIRHNCISFYYINIWTVMWNGMVDRLKLVKLKFVWYFNVSGTVDSSVVRLMIGLVNWVLGRIFGTGEREAERYVTGIVCWQQIVLGWLDKVWEGKGVGEFWDIYWKIEMMNLKGIQYKSLLLYLWIWNAVSTEISCGCLKDMNPAQDRTP